MVAPQASDPGQTLAVTRSSKNGILGKGVKPRIQDALLGAVDKAVTQRWEPARARAQATSAEETEARVREVIKAFRGELATVGALAGGAAAVPGVTTGAVVATGIADLGWVTLRLSDLILTAAAIHGHGQASVEERRAWILSVLAFGDGAAVGFSKVASEVGKGLGGKAVAKLPTSSLRVVNRAIGRTVVTKYGVKRGAVALGRALPFGVGAAIGAGANILTVEAVGRHANGFFRQLSVPD